MGKKSLSKELTSYLYSHIKEIEKETELLVKTHYGEDPEELSDIKEFFREYTGKIAVCINSQGCGEDTAGGFPFAIINSCVEVIDMEDNGMYRYYINFPYARNTYNGMDCASCLSPLGKALLFKRTGQEVNIQIPAGTLRYVIKRIFLPDRPDSEYELSRPVNER